MKLYVESNNEKFSEVFELDNKDKEKKVLYMLENYENPKMKANLHLH